AKFDWPAGSSPGSRSLKASAAIEGHADADPSDNSRLATINVGSGDGVAPAPTPAPGIRFRVYTYYSTYQVGGIVILRHIVETSSGQRVSGATIEGTV